MVEEAGGYYRFHFDATLYKIFVNLTFFLRFCNGSEPWDLASAQEGMLSGKKVEAEDEIKSDDAELDITIAGVTNLTELFVTGNWLFTLGRQHGF